MIRQQTSLNTCLVRAAGNGSYKAMPFHGSLSKVFASEAKDGLLMVIKVNIYKGSPQ